MFHGVLFIGGNDEDIDNAFPNYAAVPFTLISFLEPRGWEIQGHVHGCKSEGHAPSDCLQ